MRLLLFFIFLLAMPAQAQLQVLYDGTPLRPLIDLGSAGAGDGRLAVFTLRNVGETLISISTVSVAGTGFSIFPKISLPIPIAAGQSSTVTVLFQAASPGNYSAALVINDWQVFLKIAVLEGVVLVDSGGGSRRTLGAGSSVDFGSTTAGRTLERDLSLENQGSTTLLVPTTTVSGEGIRLVGNPSGNTIKPGGALLLHFEAVSDTSVNRTGMLYIGGKQYPLSATFLEPVLPAAKFVVDNASLRSGSQTAISIVLEEDPQANAIGMLSIGIRANNAVEDRGLFFLPSGKQSISCEVRKGIRTVQCGSSSVVMLQTGTTSFTGVLLFQSGNRVDTYLFYLAPMGIQIDSARAMRTPSTLEVVLSGFDNTRSAGGEVYFTFYDRNGIPLPNGAYSKAALQDQFRQLFSTSNAGGLFELKASFPVTGDVTAISAVAVQLANNFAVTKTDRIKLQ